MGGYYCIGMVGYDYIGIEGYRISSILYLKDYILFY